MWTKLQFTDRYKVFSTSMFFTVLTNNQSNQPATDCPKAVDKPASKSYFSSI